MCQFLAPQHASAEIEWTTKAQLDLDVAPLDIHVSADGQNIFVLAPGEVLIYSTSRGEVTERLSVDIFFDSLTYSSKDNSLILSSSSEQIVRIIQMDVIHEIFTTGLPFKGPEEAPVIIAVFNDYQ